VKQVVEYLQLLNGLDRTAQFDLICRIMNTDVRHILEATHYKANRVRISSLKGICGIRATSSTTLDVIRKLLYENPTTIGMTSELYYVLFKLNSDSISQSTRDMLQETLGYVPMATKTVRTSRSTKKCDFCGAMTTTDICYRCKYNIFEYTNSRRESFEVPVNYLNFKEFVEDTRFVLRYKDWAIEKVQGKLIFTLVNILFDSIREDYELPFIENQKVILR
jgi:hypothetical protein